LWTLTKTGHVCRATVRRVPEGPELRILIDHELIWSRVLSGATDRMLHDAAASRLRDFASRGWRIAPPLREA
jgi:hypothetical protein